MLRQKLGEWVAKLPGPLVFLIFFIPFIFLTFIINGTFFVFLPSDQWFWLGHTILLIWIAGSFAWNYFYALQRTVHLVPLAALLRKAATRIIFVPFLFSPLFVYGTGFAATAFRGAPYEAGRTIYKQNFHPVYRGRYSLNFSCADYKMDQEKLDNIYFLQSFCISTDAYKKIPDAGGFISLNGKRSWFGRVIFDYKIEAADDRAKDLTDF